MSIMTCSHALSMISEGFLKTACPLCSNRCAMTYSYVCHDVFICVPWLLHLCAVTHSFFFWRPHVLCAATGVTWIIHMCARLSHCVCHDSFICVQWLIHLFFEETACPLCSNRCDMPQSYVWPKVFICVPWLIHMCAVTHSFVFGRPYVLCAATGVTHDSIDHSFVCRDSFIYFLWSICPLYSNRCAMSRSFRVPWRIYTCAVTHSFVCCDAFIYLLMGICPLCSSTCEMPHSFIHFMRAMTLSYVCRDSFVCVPWRLHIFYRTACPLCSNRFEATHPFRVPWLIHVCAMTHPFCVPWLIDICAITHSNVPWLLLTFQDDRMSSLQLQISLMCVPWLIQMCVPWLIQMCVPWLIQMCALTHSYVWYVTFTCDMTCAAKGLSCVWHDPLICVTRLMCDITHVWRDSYVWHDSTHVWRVCVTWLNSCVTICVT